MATEIPPPVVELMEEAKNVSGQECFAGSSELGVDVTGLVAIIIFYAAVLAVGIWASWRTRKSEQNQEQVGVTGWHQSRSCEYFLTRQVMLAGREIGMFVGMLTMGATWVGGGFINGSAQETYKLGLIWTQAPFGYGLSLFISE